ncbi:hypothetical protein BpHYR1_052116 [Brachionus plicatilis]|uniref:Uncharacterized protein n=1 Tax=Brachionus plicatilis TaxID=10195 RepID=A0A3M7RPW4_BRAPC|nr:hypothetical protein BpHYR1_052116 [Brachionus plicatilis]
MKQSETASPNAAVGKQKLLHFVSSAKPVFEKYNKKKAILESESSSDEPNLAISQFHPDLNKKFL